MDRFAVVGRLHRVWSWFDTHSSDGHAKGVTGFFIDELAGHSGFADALRKVDWLIDRSGSLSVPHFDRHNGQSAKKRAESTERKRKSRNVSRETCDTGHAKRVTKARPEKRREEKKEEPPTPPLVNPEIKPPKLSEAIEAGSQLMLDSSAVEHWWNTREASGWMKSTAGGSTTPVRNWRADLASSKSWATEGSRKEKSQSQPKRGY